jgi:hypothetical protein
MAPRAFLPLIALLASFLAPAWPDTARGADRAGPTAGGQAMEVFVREGCPHCADAESFLGKLRRERPALRVTVRDVSRDAAALAALQGLVARHPGTVAGVPAFHANGRLLVGFVDEATSGPRIRDLLDRPSPAQGTVELPWIGTRVSLDDVGLPVFTIVLGLLDGFNPCSMWVLVMMISMLAAVGDRRRMVAIAGTFVVVEGIAYLAFMAAWLNLFLLVGISRASEVVLGLVALAAGLVNVKDFFAFGRGLSLSIPATAKPGIVARMHRLLREQRLAVAIAGTVVLAVLVQIVELLCTSGLPALYTRILTLRHLDPWAYYGYLLLYNAAYMVDDVIVLGIGVATLSRERLQEKEGRSLKLLSGVVMLLLGLYLLVAPR